MSYLDEHGLARYDGLIKQWVTLKSGTVDGIDPLLNWQRTSTAGAVTFYPLPAAPIDPTVDFLFSETGPASGTKAPDNPSTITGVTQVKVTRCGKNLFKRPYSTASGSTIYTTTFSVDNETGTVTANTPTSSPNNAVFWLEGGTSSVRLVGGKTYYLSGCPAGGGVNTYRLGLTFYSLNHEPIGPSFYEYGDGCVVTPSVDCYFVATATVRAGATVSNLVFKPMLEEATAATAFEPYDGADYTIPLGGTFYGGSVDLSAGTMTVTWTAVRIGDFQNSLQYNSANNRWEIFVTPKANYNINAICTRSIFKNGSEFTDATDGVFRWAAGNLGQWLWFKSPAATAEAFLAIYGNAYVAFALATPYTVQLTPTQIYSLSQPDPYNPRTNTVYSDQVSVQVGYPKSPIATASELTNAIVSLGSNL